MRQIAKWNTPRPVARAAWACVASWVIFVQGPALCWSQTVEVTMTPEHWIVGEKNERIAPTKSLQDNGRIVDHAGRRSLKLAKAFAYVRDLDLQNGTIDADLAFGTEGDFVGIAFRVQSEDDYELFFFRKGASGSNEAVQYTPSFMGANAWQLYNVPTYAGVSELPPGEQWFHVKVVVSGLEAKLFLNNSSVPALDIPDLKQGYSKGSIGFWGQSGGGYVSNVTYKLDNKTYDPQLRQQFVSGALTDWELSDAFDAAEKNPGAYPDIGSLKWEKVKAENPGMIVIQRYRRDPNVLPPQDQSAGTASRSIPDRVPGSKFVFAKTNIHSDTNQNRKMNFGYSDEVVVYLNGHPIYAGNNAFNAREQGFLGLINPDNDVAYLPLRKGDNELVLAVTEFFGGWGFMCRLEPATEAQK
jgi:hypothetical protein